MTKRYENKYVLWSIGLNEQNVTNLTTEAPTHVSAYHEFLQEFSNH